MATGYDDEAPRMGAGWGWMLASGVVAIVLGVLALFSPFPATYAATLIVGAFLLVAGGLALVAGLGGRGHARRGYLIGYGVLSLALGVLIAFEPVAGALSLTLLVAAWLGARGVMEFAVGVRARAHRAAMIALGVVNLLLAALILYTVPYSALTLPGYILAISFLAGGAAEVAAALSHRRGAPAFAAA
jgi:uncharacterized membrane protein HdeD (DUF308 family)